MRKEFQNNAQGAYGGNTVGMMAAPSMAAKVDVANNAMRGANGFPGMQGGMGQGGVPQSGSGGGGGGMNLFKTNKSARADIGDYTMRTDMLSEDERKVLQIGCGIFLMVVMAATAIFFIFFEEHYTVLREEQNRLYCDSSPCLHSSSCHEMKEAGTFRCECQPGYYGLTCATVRVTGRVFTDGALAGCQIVLLRASGGPCVPPQCSAEIMTQFDGSFTFTVNPANILSGGLRIELNTSNSRCMDISVNANHSTVLMQQIDERADVLNVAVTPITTLEAYVKQQCQSTLCADAIRGAALDWGSVMYPPFRYGIDSHAVNYLQSPCDSSCVRAFCTAAMIQNTVGVIGAIVGDFGGSVPYRAIASELVYKADLSTLNLTESVVLDRILRAGKRFAAADNSLPAVPPSAARDADARELETGAVSVLYQLNQHIYRLFYSQQQSGGGLASVQDLCNGVQRASRILWAADGMIRNLTVVATQLGMQSFTMAWLRPYQSRLQLVGILRSLELPERTIHKVSGVVSSDGFYQGCRVYVDLDGDSRFNASSEQSSLTNEFGQYKIDIVEEGGSTEQLIDNAMPVRLDINPGCQSSFNGLQPWLSYNSIAGATATSPLSTVASFPRIGAQSEAAAFSRLVDLNALHANVIQTAVSGAASLNFSWFDTLVVSANIEIASRLACAMVGMGDPAYAAINRTAAWRLFSQSLATEISTNSDATKLFRNKTLVSSILNWTLSRSNTAVSRRSPLWIAKIADTIVHLCKETVDIGYAAALNQFLDTGTVKPDGRDIPYSNQAGGRALLEVLRHEYVIWTRIVRSVERADLVATTPDDVFRGVPMDRATLKALRAGLDLAENQLNECISQPCQHGGTCEGFGNLDYFCICPTKYRGDNCQIAILDDNVWIQSFIMEVTFCVGIALVIIPTLTGIQVLLSEAREGIEEAIHGLSHMHDFDPGTLDENMQNGFKPLAGPVRWPFPTHTHTHCGKRQTHSRGCTKKHRLEEHSSLSLSLSSSLRSSLSVASGLASSDYCVTGFYRSCCAADR